MITVSLIGYGNVASHLLSAFQKTDSINVLQVFSRSELDIPSNAIPVVYKLEEVQAADIVLLAVTDNAIAEVSENLPFKNKLVVHTSGSIPIQALSNHNRKGVFYPLQTFSRGRELSFQNIPICIEAETKNDERLLTELAQAISGEVQLISSEERKKLHVAAVWGNNFSNHLFHQAALFLEENNLSFDLLKPLLLETVQKLETLTPEQAQTGPAKRGDYKTIRTHLELLPEGIQRHLYSLLTESIKQTFKNKTLGEEL